MSTENSQTDTSTGDHERFMAACLRLAMRHDGLTGTNPAVGTLLVKHGLVVGKGITARGGRPHAERKALDMAGENARGATAYVSLEPCAHHGVTPPCAQALIDAGVAKVFTAWTDPDNRVDGKGHAMLRAAGIEVQTGLCAEQARRNLLGYLTRKSLSRPMVTLKLAVSANGKLGRIGQEVAITGAMTKATVHRLRARHDAILVGRGTMEADDPDLTCRLPGLEIRSPHRFVLDAHASMKPGSRLAQTARDVPVTLVTANATLPDELSALGVRHGACEQHDGKIAIPELLDDMAAQGITTLMVEGGAKVARSFLQQGLVDRIALFTSAKLLAAGQGDPIDSPLNDAHLSEGFDLDESLSLGPDTARFYVRK